MLPDIFFPGCAISSLEALAQRLPPAAPLFLCAINLMTLLLFGADKEHARRGTGRIPERILLFLSILGGSLGALAGMQLFRHKTRHNTFRIGIPAILLIQLSLAGILFLRYLA